MLLLLFPFGTILHLYCLAATSRSVDYLLSGGIVSLAGSEAKSDVYRNVGRLFVPNLNGQTLEGHRLISSKQSDRLEVANTGFRLLPSFDSSAEGSITGADRIITHIDGTTSVLPALAMSLAGGVVQFSSAEHGEPDNVRPLLEWEGLEPFEGVPSDLFTFSVFYQDEDGDPPQYVKLHLDDSEHLMQAVGKKVDYAEGVIYSVQVDGLSWGPHEFSFQRAMVRIR